jgi:dTDP-4-dehydrorhamnose 3,5-epimerase
MELVSTAIEGCYRLQLEMLRDERGHFANVFDVETVRVADPSFTVVRGCRSLTLPQGAIRGLHYQRPPKADTKLVQCLEGAVFDVCVDLRPDSATYLRWVGTELSPENQELVIVPKELRAPGFQTLREHCVVEYLSARPTAATRNRRAWNDPTFDQWPLPCSMISPREQRGRI